MQADTAPSAPSALSRVLRAGLNLVRGALIGIAEVIPGVSGGTIALITGVYAPLIAAASHVVTAARRLVLGPNRLASAREQLRRTDWALIVPVLIGMAVAVLTLAGVVEGLVTSAPEHARGLFFGLVAASIAVPLRMLPPRAFRASRAIGEGALFLAAAAVAFLLIGFADGGVIEDPPLWAVFLVAAVAICALVIPGVSGSFFLLAVGLYVPTLRAVDERDLGYIGVFALGAIAGLATTVQGIAWLLEHRRRATLIAMSGLMLGSLRALWPWQGSAGESGTGALQAPYDPILGPVLLAVGGAVAVLLLVAVEARIALRNERGATGG